MTMQRKVIIALFVLFSGQEIFCDVEPRLFFRKPWIRLPIPLPRTSTTTTTTTTTTTPAPMCPAALLGGCLPATNCPETLACATGGTGFDATCYNGPAAMKAAMGCAAVATDCACGITPATCPAAMLGGCTPATNCNSGGAATPCAAGGTGHDATCYNGPVAMKVSNGCMSAAANCDCAVGG